MTSTLIDLQVHSGIATLILNRPDKRNAMSDAMRTEHRESVMAFLANSAAKE